MLKNKQLYFCNQIFKNIQNGDGEVEKGVIFTSS